MRCQAVAKPFFAEYWCIGAITTRFFSVSSRSVRGVNSRGWLMSRFLSSMAGKPPGAVVASRDPSRGEQFVEMLGDGAHLDRRRHGALVVLGIDQADADHLLEPARRLREQGENLVLAGVELRLVGREVGQHAVAVRVDAAMMRGDPHPRGDGGQALERAAERAQVGGGVAVVRTEAGEVDVADERD